MTDPNWLPSTLAQATAALVAIIGGFLVSRLVSLLGEHAALKQQRHQLTGRLRTLEAAHDRVHQRRLAVSEDWFKEQHLSDFLDARGDVDIMAALEDFTPRGSTEEEMSSYAEWLTSHIRRAFATLDGPDAVTAEEYLARLAETDEVDSELEELVDAVARRLKTHADRWTAPPIPLSDDIALQRQDANIAHEIDLQLQIETLAVELRVIENQLLLVSRPTGIVPGLVVLTGYALVGVIFPMIVMSMRPVPAGTGVRIAMVTAFAAGFAALVTYLVVYLGKLRWVAEHPVDGSPEREVAKIPSSV